jgi:hypothetical protein
MRKTSRREFARAASAALLLLGLMGPAVAQEPTRQQRAAELAMIGDAEQGKLDFVRKCLRSIRVSMRDDRGRTALLAATHNRLEVARLLIDRGADVNAKDTIKDTPFLYAGAEGCVEILKLTLARANLKDTNRYGGTALIPAAHHGHVEAVKVLLGTAIDKDHVNNLGWTALLEAVILGDGGKAHTEIVRLFSGSHQRRASPTAMVRRLPTPRRNYGEIVRICQAPVGARRFGRLSVLRRGAKK